MLIKTCRVVPKFTLARFNCEKKKWLNPVELSIEEKRNGLEVSFMSLRGLGFDKFSRLFPKEIDINERLKLALTAFLCEGTKPERGAFY